MKPKNSPCEERQGDLFKIELSALVDATHPLVKLAGQVAWARLDETFGALFCEDNGRPAHSKRLVKAARERGLALRQSYTRTGKLLLLKNNRYAHARQMKRAAKCQRKLKTILGRVLRELERNCPRPDAGLKKLMEISQRIYER